jgi:hypothetical protein
MNATRPRWAKKPVTQGATLTIAAHKLKNERFVGPMWGDNIAPESCQRVSGRLPFLRPLGKMPRSASEDQTLPAHRLAGANRHGALYSSRRAPHYSSHRGPGCGRLWNMRLGAFGVGGWKPDELFEHPDRV